MSFPTPTGWPPTYTEKSNTNPIKHTQSFHSITNLFTYSILSSAHNLDYNTSLLRQYFKNHIINEISLDDRCYVNNTLYSSPLTHVETWLWPSEKAETCYLSNKFSSHHHTSSVLTAPPAPSYCDKEGELMKLRSVGIWRAKFAPK